MGGGTISEGGAVARRNGRIGVRALSGQDRWVAARRLRILWRNPWGFKSLWVQILRAWRNWHTHKTEALVGVKSIEGSSPFARTIFGIHIYKEQGYVRYLLNNTKRIIL